MKVKKIYKGLFWGLIAGVIDIIPMIFQKLPWNANLSAFSHWIIIGFIISTSTLRIKSIFKGLFIAILLFVPIAFIVGYQEPISLIPMSIMTLILGSFLGWIIER